MRARPIYMYALSLLLLIGMASCGGPKKLVLTEISNSGERIDSTEAPDPEVEALIAPYKAQLDAEMNKTIGYAERDLHKDKPESLLGNFMAEMLLSWINQHYDSCDIAVVNYGGIRIPTLAEGDITKGKVFELMPFDNLVVTMQLDGETMALLFDRMAAAGGWPIAGATYIIDDGLATKIMVGGEPFDITATYTVALSDYLANGGDQLSMLIGLEQMNTGVLLRDAIIEYIEQTGNINAEMDGRVQYADKDE